MTGALVFEHISPMNEVVFVISQNLIYRVCSATMRGRRPSYALKSLVKRITSSPLQSLDVKGGANGLLKKWGKDGSVSVSAPLDAGNIRLA